MARYVVMKGIVNGQLRKPDGQGPPKEIYKFKTGEVFESQDYPQLSNQAIEHLVTGGHVQSTRAKVSERVAGEETKKANADDADPAKVK